MLAAGAATIGTAWLADATTAFGLTQDKDKGPALTQGDVAVLRFLAAAEMLESDLWQRHNELAAVAVANSGYLAGLEVLDGDMPQYVSDNTDDEINHARSKLITQVDGRDSVRRNRGPNLLAAGRVDQCRPAGETGSLSSSVQDDDAAARRRGADDERAPMNMARVTGL